jgi:hypothetical protein
MKKWYLSKTLWVNAIAIGAIVAQSQTGFIIAPELEIAILSLINLSLRVVTKENVVWK